MDVSPQALAPPQGGLPVWGGQHPAPGVASGAHVWVKVMGVEEEQLDESTVAPSCSCPSGPVPRGVSRETLGNPRKRRDVTHPAQRGRWPPERKIPFFLVPFEHFWEQIKGLYELSQSSEKCTS